MSERSRREAVGTTARDGVSRTVGHGALVRPAIDGDRSSSARVRAQMMANSCQYTVLRATIGATRIG